MSSQEVTMRARVSQVTRAQGELHELPMAERPEGYGFTAEVKAKIQAKYDERMEQEVRHWIEAVVGEPLNKDVPKEEPLGQARMREALKDGIMLMRLMNKLQPDTLVERGRSRKSAFFEMANIEKFLDAAVRYGVPTPDCFQVSDLYDGCNMLSVLTCIDALGRAAQEKGFDGPRLGVKLPHPEKHNWTAEQLRAGHGIIGLQSGSNKTAGTVNFGAQRNIYSHQTNPSDIRGHDVIPQQMGGKALTKPENFGRRRDVGQFEATDFSGHGDIGKQMGSKALTQPESFGKPRDIRQHECSYPPLEALSIDNSQQQGLSNGEEERNGDRNTTE